MAVMDKDIARDWCEHKETKMIGWVDRVNLDEIGHHTNFYLMQCIKCKQYVGFPDDNYKDAIRAGWKPNVSQVRKLVGWWER